MSTIWFFDVSEEFGFLSNFYPCSIYYRNRMWPSSEHIYQGLKYDNDDIWEILRSRKHAEEAANYVRSLSHEECSLEHRIRIMRTALALKFSQNDELRVSLLKTAPYTLIENNPADELWGIGRGNGENRLGYELMRLRSYYMAMIPPSQKQL